MTHAGKVRERNEDSCLVRTDAGLWAVADGMGGHEAGDLASRILVESLDAIAAARSRRSIFWNNARPRFFAPTSRSWS